MARIAFIGAGSFGFTRSLARDVLTFPGLRDATLVLMDMDRERLDFSTRAVRRIIREGNYPAKLVSTTNRRKALEGADAVLCTILVGDVSIWQHDILIPKKYGVDINVGDTRGPSGIFRALRTIPVMLDICRDMEDVCPDAILLNYTNPMAMLCRAMQQSSTIKLTGLCHSVQGTALMLASWIGTPIDEITYVCAGINHQAWFIRFEWNGKDAYPLIRKAMKRKSVWNQEQVRNEMFLQLGYYVSESSGHNSEYNSWFRKRSDLIEKYCTHGTGWNPGHHAYILHEYMKRKRTWKRGIRDWINDKRPLNLKRGHEYAASVINAWMNGEPFRFNGNVPNTGVITNLPSGACVEVPVYVDRRGFNAIHVGSLPPQCATLNNMSIAVEEMAIAGALTGDPRPVFHAVCYDPLTAAVLSLKEIRGMVNAMFKKNREYLPQFRDTKV